MEIAELTNMCMIEDSKNEKVLVQNRKKGSWTGIAFPGGHIEKGESIVESVIREVKEETNLDIDNIKLCGIKDWYEKDNNKRYIVLLFKTQTFSGELLENGEEGDVYWVDKKSVYSLDLADGFDKMLDVMLSETLNEYFVSETFEQDGWKHELM
ncbi:8-oxo-dGTP diphosphatase [Haloimpatiens massiliensis]|uniref:8-oxo-dGTP diphosphatase n=1 Tax=Haloimpatiens massiliensis TaxID=1658110 RepID=UPI000C85524A|nr:8-oxo-dGTP diphosphatase [Haloimpatiens massiliensis]